MLTCQEAGDFGRRETELGRAPHDAAELSVKSAARRAQEASNNGKASRIALEVPTKYTTSPASKLALGSGFCSNLSPRRRPTTRTPVVLRRFICTADAPAAALFSRTSTDSILSSESARTSPSWGLGTVCLRSLVCVSLR